MSIRKRDRVTKPWECRVHTSEGRQTSRSFRTQKEAQRWERDQQSRMDRGEWVDPNAARITFEVYATRWLAHKPQLRPRTREVYASYLHRHLMPAFGVSPLAKITTPAIREWNARMIRDVSETTAAKCYRLLATILHQAVDDQLL
jgi:hypothetical protein